MVSSSYKTIFAFLRRFNTDSIQGASERTVQLKTRTFANIKNLIKSGVFTKSESEKFICQNYELKGSELTEKWNKSHEVNYGSSVTKSESTFRAQIRMLSIKILYLLDLDSTDALNNFLVIGLSESDEEVEIDECCRLISICEAFSYDDLDFKQDFGYSLKHYLYDCKNEMTYDLAECTKELELLRLMQRSNLEKLFEKYDKDKLAFLVSQMDKDLVVMRLIKKDSSEVPVGANYCVPELNVIKAKLNKAFSTSKKAVLKVESSQSVNGVQTKADLVAEQLAIDEPKNLEVPNTWGITTSQEMFDVIQKHINKKSLDASAGTDDAVIDRLAEKLKTINVEAIPAKVDKYLSKFDVLDIQAAIVRMGGAVR